jgi:hypothetical protein
MSSPTLVPASTAATLTNVPRPRTAPQATGQEGVEDGGEGNTFRMYIGLGTLLIVILLLILIF